MFHAADMNTYPVKNFIKENMPWPLNLIIKIIISAEDKGVNQTLRRGQAHRIWRKPMEII